MWKSEDSCTFFECVSKKSGVKISSYRKSCPALQTNCPKHRRVVRDCCTYCSDDTNTTKRQQTDEKDFIHKPDKYEEIMDPQTYLNHPCARQCKEGAEPMVCNYTFLVSVLKSKQQFSLIAKNF